MPPKKNSKSDGDDKNKMQKVSKKKEAILTTRTTAKVKKSPPETPRNSEEEEVPMWDLGKQYFVKIHDFWGTRCVDIRCYYYKDGQRKPSRKGISLNVTMWKKFVKSLKEINEAIESKSTKKQIVKKN